MTKPLVQAVSLRGARAYCTTIAIILSALSAVGQDPAPATEDIPTEKSAQAPVNAEETQPADGAALDTPDLNPLPPDSTPYIEPEALPIEEGVFPETQTEFVDPYNESRALYQETEMERAYTMRTTPLDGFGGLSDPMSSPLSSPVQKARGIKAGPFTFFPSIGAGVIGGTGRFNSGSKNSPGVSGFGSFGVEMQLTQPAYDRSISLTYHITGTAGSFNDNTGPVNQLFTFETMMAFSRLQLNFGLTYAGLSGTSRDVGSDSNRNFITAFGSATYTISEKTSIVSTLSAPVRQISEGVNSVGITSTTFFNYTVDPKLTIGPGATFGTLVVEDGDLQTYQQALLQIQYVPSHFIALSGYGGYQFRQVQGSVFTTPVFGASLTWTPRLGTSLSISGDRSVSNSLTVTNTNYTQTTLTIGGNQRITNRANLGLSFSYENATYESVGSGGENGRIDNLVQGQLSLSYLLRSNWTASLAVSMGQNFSNDRPQRFQQAVLQTTYSF